jgi:hypothetical protein
MNPAVLSALSALGGSVIGALGGVVTTWLTMFAQERSRRLERAASRRESLYGEFIDEASRVFGDALTHNLEDASRLVKLYAILSKLRLFAPSAVLIMADKVVDQVLETYQNPELDLGTLVRTQDLHNLDVLRTFSDACRRDLVV